MKGLALKYRNSGEITWCYPGTDIDYFTSCAVEAMEMDWAMIEANYEVVTVEIITLETVNLKNESEADE